MAWRRRVPSERSGKSLDQPYESKHDVFRIIEIRRQCFVEVAAVLASKWW